MEGSQQGGTAAPSPGSSGGGGTGWMRTVSLTSFGTEDGFHFLKTHPRPQVEDEDGVLVRIKTCALTQLDKSARLGHFPEITKLPIILGFAISGVVEKIGLQVTRFKPGDEVIALCPLDSGGGYSQYIVLGHQYLAHKPLELSHEDAVASLYGGVWSYTALHYQVKMTSGETALILNGASEVGHIAVQLAARWGAKVITTASSPEEFNYLQDLRVPVDKVIDLSSENLVEAVLEETGGLGVDFILDPTLRTNPNFSTPEPSPSRSQSPSAASSSASSATTTPAQVPTDTTKRPPLTSSNSSSSLQTSKSSPASTSMPKLPVVLPTENDLAICLAAHGRWVTSSFIQLDPPQSRMLFLKSASVSFGFEQSWILASAQLGRYLHILTDLMEKVSREEVVPKVGKIFKLEKIREAHRTLDTPYVGSIIIKH